MTRTAYHGWSSKDDVLLLRFQINGTKQQPYVIFKERPDEEETPNYAEILADEKKRHERKTRKDLDDLLFDADYCAFLYLDEDLVPSNHETTKDLDALLGVSKLLRNIKIEYNSWCDCKKSGEGAMIECNNAKCDIGWYHKSCVKLRDDYTADFWLCTRCQIYKIGDAGYDYIPDLKVDYDKVALASSERVNFTRSVERIVNKHIFPPKEEIVRLFEAVPTECEGRYCRLVKAEEGEEGEEGEEAEEGKEGEKGEEAEEAEEEEEAEQEEEAEEAEEGKEGEEEEAEEGEEEGKKVRGGEEAEEAEEGKEGEEEEAEEGEEEGEKVRGGEEAEEAEEGKEGGKAEEGEEEGKKGGGGEEEGGGEAEGEENYITFPPPPSP